MANICKGVLQAKEEDQIKEKEELEKIENEQKLEVRYDLHDKMKNECLMVLGNETYAKLYKCLKKAKIENTDFFELQKKIETIVGNNKDKINKAFLIDQIIECEKSNNSSL